MTLENINPIQIIVTQNNDQTVQYRYGMASRPLSLNTCPKGHIAVEGPDERFNTYFTQFGVLVYPEPLSVEDANHYNLPLLVESSMNEALADYVLEYSDNKHLHDYIEDESIPNRQAALIKIATKMLGDGPIAFEDKEGLIEAMETGLALHSKENQTTYDTPR